MCKACLWHIYLIFAFVRSQLNDLFIYLLNSNTLKIEKHVCWYKVGTSCLASHVRETGESPSSKEGGLLPKPQKILESIKPMHKFVRCGHDTHLMKEYLEKYSTLKYLMCQFDSNILIHAKCSSYSPTSCHLRYTRLIQLASLIKYLQSV